MSLLTQFYPGPGGGGGGGGSDGGTVFGGVSDSGFSAVYVSSADGSIPRITISPITAGYGGFTNPLESGNTAGYFVAPSGSTLAPVLFAAYYNVSAFNVTSNTSAIYFQNMRLQLSGNINFGGVTTWEGGFFYGGSNTITASSLTSIANVTFYSTTTINAPNLTTLTNVNVSGDGASSVLIITGAKLTAASVNNTLIATAASVGAFGGDKNINFSGGTSAGTSALTAAGLAAVSTITAGGGTVTLNA